MTGERTYSGLRFWSLFLAALFFVDLVLVTVLVVLHAQTPLTVYVVLLFPLFYILMLSLFGSLAAGLVWFFLRYPAHRKTLLILVLITTGIFVAHLYTINQPPTSSCFDSQKFVDGCVMDEIYYVPAAQALLTGEKCGPYLDNCNLEHPFLSKAFIAAGIVLFGNNDFGWRFMIVLLGTASIPVLFAICWKVSRDSTLALFAAYLLAFETLFFIHSSIAVIDVQGVFFALLAFLAYLADLHIWRFNRFIISGFLLGLSALSKETAIFLLLFLVAYNMLYGAGSRLSRLFSSAQVFFVTALVFIVGLQVYVTIFGNSSMHSFLDDIRYIIDYGGSLKGTGWIDQVLHTPITPINWVTYYSAVGYFITRVTINGTYTYTSLGYWGIPNFIEVWLIYLWMPYVAYLGIKRWRRSRARKEILVASAPAAENPVVRSLDSLQDAPVVPQSTVESRTDQVPEPDAQTEDRPDPSFTLGKFAFLWFSFTYFPYFLIYFYGRVTYPFYLIPAIPAIAIGGAYLFTRRWFPREVTYVLLAGVFFWFFLYYPDKDFLPTFLRMILGH